MPIYEYECAQCRHRWEWLARTPSAVPAACPACGAHKLRKVFSAFSVGAASKPLPRSPACASCSHGTCPYGQK